MNDTTYRYINLQKIKEDTFGDITVLRMIIELFIEGVDEYLDTFNNELPNKNWQILFQETHKIKPNVSMFGIETLVEPILELETCFRNEESLDKVDALVNIVIPSFIEVKKELQTELKSMPNE